VTRIVIGDFHCIAGDTGLPASAEALLAVPARDYLAAPASWHDFVLATRSDAYPYERFAFSAPEHWDRTHLAALVASLPPGHVLRRVDESTYDAFATLNHSFVDNFHSRADYLSRGVGFCVADDRTGEIVAGCSSYTISTRCLEFEIETRRDHQRRGLALVTGARLIEHCLDNALVPYWDAAHQGSARLAERLGFVGRRVYTAYRVGAPPPSADASPLDPRPLTLDP
jgi:RimJ/RimL family protein N-acetyltransferase